MFRTGGNITGSFCGQRAFRRSGREVAAGGFYSRRGIVAGFRETGFVPGWREGRLFLRPVLHAITGICPCVMPWQFGKMVIFTKVKKTGVNQKILNPVFVKQLSDYD